MQLAQLIAGLPDVLATAGSLDVAVSRIVSDSRQASPGALFVAYRGIGVDGHRYIPDALARGAGAVVGEDLPPQRASTTYVQVPDGRAALGWLHAAWHGQPSLSMALVGVTGTDGKTTTANLLYSILAAAGRRAGLISTVNAVIGQAQYDTGLHTTTPDAADVQRYLAEMRAVDAEIAVLETTSHGLSQHRVTGCLFDVAVVTNITHEHLDFHGSYEAYRAAKALLFRSLAASPAKPHFPALPKTSVLNRDDSSFAYLAAIPAQRYITYGLSQETAAAAFGAPAAPVIELAAAEIRHTPAGTAFNVGVAGLPGFPPVLPLTTRLVGVFNVYNILAAAAAALGLGMAPAAIRTGVANLSGVPGRMERIDRGQAFTALVDFAHTPNALARALETAATLTGTGGRVICVFGSAGLRDRAKRRLMGRAAAQLADYTVITAEDPRTEDLAVIMAETADEMAGLGKVEGVDYVRVPDRQAAMMRAVEQARPGDVVIVCGKGHEQSMCFGTVEHPWRDQDALAWALERGQGRGGDAPPFVLPTWGQRSSR
jgi:UDP-N-acetylmuramoyl-L-alanyl-D-glutamate--2,6-diaminopimelate ligase